MIDYPKCLYAKDGTTVTVQSTEEESLFVGEGWLTAAQYHNYPAEASKDETA